MKALVIAAALTAALLISPAKAADEMVSYTLDELADNNKTDKDFQPPVKATDEQIKNLDQVFGPQPRKGDIYILRYADRGMILIVRNGVVVFNSPPAPLALVEKALKGKGENI